MIREVRHVHPHEDPRQPRDASVPGTNPPVFVWHPSGEEAPYRLRVARGSQLTTILLEAGDLQDPVFLPTQTLPPGRAYWAWEAGGRQSQVFSVEISETAVVVEVPPVATWLERFGTQHPRLFIRPDKVAGLRESRADRRAEAWAALKSEVDPLLGESHELAEPPYMDDRSKDYTAFIVKLRQTVTDARQFIRRGELLALAYLASGEQSYADAAKSRLLSLCSWDPRGSSFLGHNDEAHMPIMWWGPTTADWVWDTLSEFERDLVVAHFRERGLITYEFMHDQGCYGISRFDSHAGRETVFLALLAIVFHDRIPEARGWLEWLRPVLCGVWPIWAGDPGGWSEGVGYGMGYVSIMSNFTAALAIGAQVDLFKRPFWRNHAQWFRWMMPPYAQWLSFGDNPDRNQASWERAAQLLEVIMRRTSDYRCRPYLDELWRQLPDIEDPGYRIAMVEPQLYLTEDNEGDSPAPPSIATGMLKVFPDVGWAAIRTDIERADRDVALLFRSSVYGSRSHSHANNNDFALHVGGQTLLMPSGYYWTGYGAPHHIGWVWHTESHNCITLSGASQLMQSRDANGAIIGAQESAELIYLQGVGDASYRTHASRCRRHVLFLKRTGCIVLIDEVEAAPGVSSLVEWNAHSWGEFSLDPEHGTFHVKRGGAALSGYAMWHQNCTLLQRDGWDPPPTPVAGSRYQPQYHLQVMAYHRQMAARVVLGVVLAPQLPGSTATAVTTQAVDGVEIARIGDDLVAIGQDQGLEIEGQQTTGFMLARVAGRWHQLTHKQFGPLQGRGEWAR